MKKGRLGFFACFQIIDWVMQPGLLIFIITFIPVSIFAQPAPTDIGWPRQISRNDAKLIYYQPQVKDWKDYKELDADFAFALTPKGGNEIHGVASATAQTIVDKDNRSVFLKDISFSSVRFPSLDENNAKGLDELFRELMPASSQTISLDRLMADIDQSKTTAKTVLLKNDPPQIFYSASPAIMLIVQGDPVLTPVEKTDLDFVVNANWDIFYEKSRKYYYLLADKTWFTSSQLSGPWTATKTLPKDMAKLPSGENFDDVKKMVPPQASSGTAPKVFYSDVPAELMVFKGSPVYSAISGTSLLYVTNTDNDILLDNLTKTFYVLLSGRWFSAANLGGPWAYAGDNLPADFSKIPVNSPKANVLASVPGTVQASDAVLLAEIPATAVINKAEAEAKVKVSYDGDAPQFKPIDSTNLEYATNTQEKVIKYGDLYYLCFQAVWFMSTTPNGPWKTCDSVPRAIYTIPPSSPVYNITYVTQTNATETTVESSTEAGYFGAFIIGVGIGACIAYGTGWYYPPYMWWGPGMYYPVYRPWPVSYGAGYVYNPWTGGFAGGSRVYGPYGAAGTSAWYNPATGRYGRSASVQTWYGGRTAASAYNPWTGGYAATRQGHDAYSQWGTSVAARNGQAIQTAHITTAGGTTAGYRASTGQHGIIHTGDNGTVVHGNNNTFVGHDGNVYRKNSDGNWSTFNNNTHSWQQEIGGDGGTRKQLDNANFSRQRGQINTQRFQNFQRSGGFHGGGGFRSRR